MLGTGLQVAGFFSFSAASSLVAFDASSDVVVLAAVDESPSFVGGVAGSGIY